VTDHSVFTDWMLFLPPNQQRQTLKAITYVTAPKQH